MDFASHLLTIACNKVHKGARFALQEASPSVRSRDAGRGHVTHSAFSDLPSAAQRAESQAAQPPALGREAADFLIELSVTLQKRAMYPPGHPYLNTSTERLMRRAEALPGQVPVAGFGIARDLLVVHGAPADP